MTRIAILIAGLICAGTAVAQPLTPPPEQPEWFASARAFVPPDRVAGLAFHLDESDRQAPVGYIAVYPASANDPKTPTSAFDAGEMLVAKLARSDGRLTTLSAELRPRDIALTGNIPSVASAARSDDEYRDLHTELLKARAKLPDGTMPCDIHGWSEDRDPNGLNVRAEPSAKAKILGTLPAPYKFKRKGDNVPEGGWLTEFSILGFKNGWFLIEGATPPGKDYEDESVYPRNHPKPYGGRGWISASKVGAQYANGDTRMGGLFQAPHVDAQWTPAKGEGGSEIGADGGPKRILACSGFWALVESHDGVRGWWRRLCSNQVTNCS